MTVIKCKLVWGPYDGMLVEKELPQGVESLLWLDMHHDGIDLISRYNRNEYRDTGGVACSYADDDGRVIFLHAGTRQA